METRSFMRRAVHFLLMYKQNTKVKRPIHFDRTVKILRHDWFWKSRDALLKSGIAVGSVDVYEGTSRNSERLRP